MKLSVSAIIEGKIGNGTIIGYFSHILSTSKVGENCTIGSGVVMENCILGDNITVGHNTVFAGSEARSNPRGIPPRSNPTVIEEGVIIGSKVVIVGGTVIKRGTIIGDGSTVMGRIEPNIFAAGAPARLIYSLSSINI